VTGVRDHRFAHVAGGAKWKPDVVRKGGAEGTSDVGILSVMGESNGLPQTMIELVAVDDHLLGVNSLDRAEPYGEIAGILDVDDQLGPAMGRPLRN
jgi:hypothetical protein